MISKIIRSSVTYALVKNRLRSSATNVRQFGDLLADILLLIPKKTSFGLVSWSVYQQADEIFILNAQKLMNMPRVTLSGHSLGGANSVLIALIMLEHGYKGKITVKAWGSPKVLGKKTRVKLAKHIAYMSWRVRHRDIVCFLGWWKEPKHNNKREGCRRKHILDWDLQEHLMY